VAEAVRLLGWVGDHNRYRDKFVLIGHSMGGAVATMYASTFPDQIHALITLDAFGPDFEPPKNISSRIRRHLLDRYEHNVKRNENNGSSAIKQYDTLQVAAQARMRTATLAPGRHQYLSQEAATKMVQRATITAQNGDKIQFIHDQRLKHSPIFLHSPDQLEGVWKSIQCPMYCLVAKDGWPFPSGILQRAYSHVQQTGHLTVDTLTGSHHFHADPETAMAVAKAIATYIEKQGL
jgi:pimeloyl-ACP methyl ester carboxylesterase